MLCSMGDAQTLLSNCLETVVQYLASKARRNSEAYRIFQALLQIIMGTDHMRLGDNLGSYISRTRGTGKVIDLRMLSFFLLLLS